MAITLEAEFSPGMALGECQELARRIELAGFDRLGISDVVFWPDTFLVQALCAQATTSIEIGAMVTSPYLRHPVVTAAAVADLAELSGGRTFVGLGVGAGFEALGMNYPRPVSALRESVTLLRRLWAGDVVDFEGRSFQVHDARLRRTPSHPIRVAIATRSEQVARLAGEIADRALVGARYLSPAFAATYRRWVEAGATRAGRDPEHLEVAPRLTLCVSTERVAAYQTMRRDTAEFLVMLKPDDLDLDPRLLGAIESALEDARGWYFDPDAYHPPALDSLVDDGLVRTFSLCGEPDELVPQFDRIIKMGFTTLSMKLAPVRRPGQSMFEGLCETVEGVAVVVPEIKALASSP